MTRLELLRERYVKTEMSVATLEAIATDLFERDVADHIVNADSVRYLNVYSGCNPRQSVAAGFDLDGRYLKRIGTSGSF